jgi:5-methyltetrahydrofolate--homocysteine methyltransferase
MELTCSPVPRQQASGVADWLGAFANASFGVEDLVATHKAAGDDYSYIMAEALADRLAEAFAEKLHQIIRKEVCTLILALSAGIA